MSIRTFARLGALPAATAAIALSLASPASAHVSASVTDASAGAFTVLTLSVPHGCEGSPTTRIEIQVPESVLSVTPTRNPYYDLEATIEQLDEPSTDAHGNEITERTSSIVYTARTRRCPTASATPSSCPSRCPDAEGEVLAFPTIQTCEKGETAWTQVPADGQDEDELESPAPSFTILPASGEGHHGEEAAEDRRRADAHGAEPSAAPTSRDDGSSALGWAGLGAGLLGLVAGGLALARTRSTS